MAPLSALGSVVPTLELREEEMMSRRTGRGVRATCSLVRTRGTGRQAGVEVRRPTEEGEQLRDVRREVGQAFEKHRVFVVRNVQVPCKARVE